MLFNRNGWIPTTLHPKHAILGAIGATAMTCSGAPDTSPATENIRGSKPNVIIFFTDDQGYNDVGCFGSPLIKTPNFDKMAKEGTQFTSYYAQPVCGPSRAALMTGCYPIRIGEPKNIKCQHTVLHSKEITIAEVMKTVGYKTACIGKWHLAGNPREVYDPNRLPMSQGFDEFYGTPVHNGYTKEVNHKSYRAQIVRGNEVVNKAMTQDDMNMLTQNYTKEAVSFIRKNKDKPFFLYLAHNMPHVPLGASPAFRGKSARGLYGDVIQELDWSLGEVMRTLKETGIDKNTLVIFSSDNGPWVSKRLKGHYGSAAPLRGFKMSAWEGGQRVPAIMRWPGKIPAGRVTKELFTTLDLLPTCAALTDAKLPQNRTLDGKDMVDVMINKKGVKNPRKTFLYYNFMRLTAVRSGKWKLVFPRAKKAEGTGWSKGCIDEVKEISLYDMDNDKEETKDVAKEHPEIVKQIQALAEDARSELGDYNRVGTEPRFFDGPRPTEWSTR